MVHKFHIPSSRHRKSRLKELEGSLLSVAGMVGRRIVNQDDQELGTVADLVFHWDFKETYPPLRGLIAKVAWRKVWISRANIKEITPSKVVLGNARLDLREFKPRKGEVRLKDEVLDHQLIDVDGARVVRASDLYIAPLGGETRLVGVDVGYKPLLRRLGPTRFMTKVVPDSVIDWATIQSFGGGESGNELRLSATRNELRRLRPGELADLLEDLGRPERQELLNALSPELAADALEEMEPKQLEGLLRESSLEEAANYVSRMEPDEAADALREVDPVLKEELLANIPKESADNITQVLDYDEERAGGIMNTLIFTAYTMDNVSKVKQKLKEMDADPSSIGSVIIVDEEGKVLYDLYLSNLLKADDNQKLQELMKPPATLTVSPGASLQEVVETLVESRSSSVVVADENEQPIGRIFADDLLDALIPSGRFHFPRLLS
ncbi:MAG TPA: CBS domain-containing protein [Candidatus Saccharimonadales bacterium]|nr:CBS domain-containing protein [Candidatus Saccharimonadales bacterium]